MFHRVVFGIGNNSPRLAKQSEGRTNVRPFFMLDKRNNSDQLTVHT
ncbi:ATP-dependent protease peptidase subunit [Photobacterium angustum S14]|uniref:ATP-dependent protease peptidase subunit n=1 Tax=Photobacterium angustum (strain S14 / CCUG 15956) TaxID=314292 RepID=Q1ZLR6_PHOAS|nr:ATP-dependent protease peptidase subunit [Photobacterium angustum S14]